MTEITRVPLPPIARGSLVKLWLGVIVALLLALGIAHGGTPPLVSVKTLAPGSGPSPSADDFVLIDYRGTLDNGTVFDSGNHVPMQMNRVIPGFTKALAQMQRGGRYDVTIPAELAYGDQAAGPIPPNSRLHFAITLIDFRTAAQVEAQARMVQQLRAMQAARQGQAAGQAAPLADVPPPGAPAGP